MDLPDCVACGQRATPAMQFRALLPSRWTPSLLPHRPARAVNFNAWARCKRTRLSPHDLTSRMMGRQRVWSTSCHVCGASGGGCRNGYQGWQASTTQKTAQQEKARANVKKTCRCASTMRRHPTNRAEWRSGQRVGPITQRSVDRNHALLLTTPHVPGGWEDRTRTHMQTCAQACTCMQTQQDTRGQTHARLRLESTVRERAHNQHQPSETTLRTRETGLHSRWACANATPFRFTEHEGMLYEPNVSVSCRHGYFGRVAKASAC